MSIINKQIFFLIFALSSSLLFSQQVYANHYTSLGIDDAWYWKEYETDGTTANSYCLFQSTGDFLGDDGSDNIRFFVNDDGVAREPGCMYLKTFLISDIENVGGSNVFSLRFEQGCDSAPCSDIFMGILDGNYQQYYDYSDLGYIWPDDYTWTVSYPQFQNLVSGSWGDLENPTGGVTSALSCDSGTTAGTDTLTCTIDSTEWGRATTDSITVFVWHGSPTTGETNWWFEPEEFSVTNTPIGTMTWNWPETAGELTNWNLYGYHELQLNGTDHDYGYFVTFNESVPDPPTNLYAIEGSSSIVLNWEAPDFDGIAPITGYKIERESPIGNGFTTLVSNTGSTDTTYTDTSIVTGIEYNYRVRAINSHGESLPSNESKDGISLSNTTPDVDCAGLNPSTFTLYDRGITQNSVTLCWNGEILNQTALLGYQVNSTTPWGDPLTIITGLNNTGTNATTRLIENLTPATQYSFRVLSWMNASMSNVTQILNVTTLPGTLDLENFNFGGEVNPFRWDWDFTEVDLGSNYTALLVEYANTINATCVFDFRFANTNQTFYNISTVPSDESGRVVANFTLQDPENEVIYVTCSDVDNPDSEGRHVITQTSFPLLMQIQGFRAGDYGTTGDFGIFDLITFVIVIISMIGFNRINSAVAAVFSFVVITVSAYFGFIAPISAFIMGAVVIVIGIGVFMHHRNEAGL